MLAIDARDAAMAVAHVFAQANIRDHDQLGASGFDRADGLLHDAVFRVSAAGLFVFVARNAEEQHGLQAEIVGALRFIGHFRERELKNARHTADGLSRA